MKSEAELLVHWHDDEERWWNRFGEYMNYQWQLTPALSERLRGEMERDYKDFLLKPGAALLDVGCGSGWLSTYFAERGMTVTGVDVSSEQISAADQLKASRGLDSVSFQCADFMRWDVDKYKGAFESVFVSAFLHHLPPSELELIVRKIALVLKPGGRAYLYEPLQRQRTRTLPVKVIDRLYNTALHLFLNRLPRWFKWWSPRHLQELERGYSMNSPHEAPVSLELLQKCCSGDFGIVETKGWHLNSLGFAMECMSLIEPVRKWYEPVAVLCYRLDRALFRWLGWEAFSIPGRFILCSVKMVRK